MPKVEIYARTNKVGSQSETTVDISDDEWKGMDDYEREEFMLDMFWEADLIEWGWQEK